MFEHTRGKFWGGPWYSYWMLVCATIFLGFFGIDHMGLRSPTTGVLKFIVNIFGLGMWWIYDILQVLKDKNSVMANGLTVPVVGPMGIGAGMFRDDQPNAAPSKSPLRYWFYLMLVLVPFGFDHLVAGDLNGAMMKFVSTILPFLWPVLLYWMAYSAGKAYLMPKSVFEEGVDRVFPFTWFMEPKGPSILGPRDIGMEPGKESAGGFFSVLYGILPPILQSAVGTFFPTLVPAVESVAGAVKVSANAASNIINAAKGPVVATVGTASSVLQQIPGAIAQSGEVANQIGKELAAYTDPTELAKRAVKVPLMTGGGGGSGQDTALLVLFSSILLGGTYYGFKRLNISFDSWKRNADGEGRVRNDAPPQPR